MQAENLRRVCAVALFFLLIGCSPGAVGDENSGDKAESTEPAVIEKFLQATQTHEGALRGSSMQVSIEATIPKLKEHGSMKALRKISKVGTITYRMLMFQGDNTIKNEVIARYLTAEQQSQGDQSIAITPGQLQIQEQR